MALAVSGLLNLVLLVDRCIRRRKIMPVSGEELPRKQRAAKPKRLTRKQRKAAEKMLEQKAADEAIAAKEAALRVAHKEADLARGPAWSGDVAGLSMMEQAAMFASKGDVLEMTLKPPDASPVPLPPVAPKGTTPTPYTGVTKVAPPPPAFAQFTRAVSKRQNAVPLRPLRGSSKPYRVAYDSADLASQPANCSYQSFGMRSPMRKNTPLALSKDVTASAAPPASALPAPPDSSSLEMSTITQHLTISSSNGAF